MFSHSLKQCSAAQRFESPGMIEHQTQPLIDRSRLIQSGIEHLLTMAVPTCRPNTFLMTKEPGCPQGRTPDQHSIDLTGSNTPNDIAHVLDVSISQNQGGCAPSDLRRRRNRHPVRLAAIHLRQSASMNGNRCWFLLE